MPAAQLTVHVCAYLDHVLPAGKARSADPDKFWPKTSLIQQPGQIFEIWGQARSNPDKNDLPSSGQNHHFCDQGSAYIDRGPTRNYYQITPPSGTNPKMYYYLDVTISIMCIMDAWWSVDSRYELFLSRPSCPPSCCLCFSTSDPLRCQCQCSRFSNSFILLIKVGRISAKQQSESQYDQYQGMFFSYMQGLT